MYGRIDLQLQFSCISDFMLYFLHAGYYLDCKEAYEDGKTCSGVYTIKPDGLPPFETYCDMETDGGGWTVFQRRMDGTQDFYLNWADYVRGFGDLNNEFWLGLSKINRLAAPGAGATALRVDLADFSGNKAYAKYNAFTVGDSSTKYEMIVYGYISGNAGDALGYHNGQQFSTKDQDNDAGPQNCAQTFKGAWWYNDCHASNLNGQYLSGTHTSYADGVNWYHWKGNYYSLKVSEMKVRRV